ncbi:hypothetical protein, partial [Agrococcus sp. HG114]|uniref:hypothetical protein n=1 Tax=Agrococcus sp. HG114 TaxID=2969757 RepID=UPI00215A73AE
MTRGSVAVLRLTRAHGTLELLASTVARLRPAFERVVIAGDPEIAAAVRADAPTDAGWAAELVGAPLALLADDDWAGPLDDPRGWR